MIKKDLDVLLLEDHDSNAKLVEEYLARGDTFGTRFTVDRAAFLKEALQFLSKKKYDVVLMDLNVPDSKNIDTLNRIAENIRGPIIVLTGMGDQKTALAALEQGAQDYLIKGEFNRESLCRSIRYAISRYQEIATRKKSEETKDRLIGTVSHEIRNPLTVVRIALKKLHNRQDGPLTDEEKLLLDASVRNVDRVFRIAENILDLSRLESGQALIQKQNAHLAPMVQELVSNFNEHRSSRISLENKVPHDLPIVEVDPELIFQVFNNLTANALRFAHKHVTITAKAMDKMIDVSVIDDGPGISPEDQQRLFQKFGQLTRQGEKHAYKGTGLGLVICKEIIDHHDGKIWVESTVGQGTEFHFTVPVKS
jgi:signal transduction histidine kinase